MATQAQYTNDQIRSAILRAADRIEREPGSYDHGHPTIQLIRDGSGGCVWAHIGAQLSMAAASNAMHVAEACGEQMPDINGPCRLFAFLGEHSGLEWRCGEQGSHAYAVSGLRAYADKFFPASSDAPALDSAYRAFRAAFTGSPAGATEAA